MEGIVEESEVLVGTKNGHRCCKMIERAGMSADVAFQLPFSMVQRSYIHSQTGRTLMQNGFANVERTPFARHHSESAVVGFMHFSELTAAFAARVLAQ